MPTLLLYQDWGKTELFQPEVGVGECAGAAYDVVGGILQDASEKVGEAKETLEQGYWAESIYLSYSAFVIGAKAMLLARDVSCNTHKQILQDFQTHYVETGDVSQDTDQDFSAWVLRMNRQVPEKVFASTYLAESTRFLQQLHQLRKEQTGDTGTDKMVVGHHYRA